MNEKNDQAAQGCNEHESAIYRLKKNWETIQHGMGEVLERLERGRPITEELRHLVTDCLQLQFDLRTLLPKERDNAEAHGEDAHEVAMRWLIEQLMERADNIKKVQEVCADTKLERFTYEKTEYEKVTSIGTFEFVLPYAAVNMLAEKMEGSWARMLELLQEELNSKGFDDINTSIVDGEITDVDITLVNEEVR